MCLYYIVGVIVFIKYYVLLIVKFVIFVFFSYFVNKNGVGWNVIVFNYERLIFCFVKDWLMLVVYFVKINVFLIFKIIFFCILKFLFDRYGSFYGNLWMIMFGLIISC